MTDIHTAEVRRSGKSFWLIALVIIGMLSAIAWRLTNALSPHVIDKQAPRYTATVVLPEASSNADGLVVSGERHPILEAALYARTNGYLKTRNVDLGDAVKRGDVLAEIDSPEIDDQLKQARAELATAQANEHVATLTANRYTQLVVTHAVSQQDTDLKVAEQKAKKAIVASAQANVDRLEKLEGFKQVTAPFDGVITARNVDVGTLITSGISSSTQELFHLADTRQLRILVQVPQQNALFISVGQTATLAFPESPGQSIPARVTRSAQAIDPATHTLLVELEVDNHDHKILSGGYCEVHLPLSAKGSFRIPASALIFGSEGLKVATVDGSSNVVTKTVILGQDYGKQVEVTSGLTAEDKLIVNPWDSIATGQPVAIAAPTVPTESADKK